MCILYLLFVFFSKIIRESKREEEVRLVTIGFNPLECVSKETAAEVDRAFCVFIIHVLFELFQLVSG